MRPPADEESVLAAVTGPAMRTFAGGGVLGGLISEYGRAA
jgi:hypothetical protein